MAKCNVEKLRMQMDIVCRTNVWAPIHHCRYTTSVDQCTEPCNFMLGVNGQQCTDDELNSALDAKTLWDALYIGLYMCLCYFSYHYRPTSSNIGRVDMYMDSSLLGGTHLSSSSLILPESPSFNMDMESWSL